MIVYIESNFIVEIAFEQKQRAAAEAILNLAENGDVQLAFPAFTLFESFTPIARRSEAIREIEAILREMRRSAPFRPAVDEAQPLVVSLNKLKQDELHKYDTTVQRILKVGISLETNLNDFEQSLT